MYFFIFYSKIEEFHNKDMICSNVLLKIATSKYKIKYRGILFSINRKISISILEKRNRDEIEYFYLKMLLL